MPNPRRSRADLTPRSDPRAYRQGRSRLRRRDMSIGPLANALRAAVLGANDGLSSNLSLVMGVSGAHLASHAILVTGLSGLIAGACAMAMGEWLSISTSRESHETGVDVESGSRPIFRRRKGSNSRIFTRPAVSAPRTLECWPFARPPRRAKTRAAMRGMPQVIFFIVRNRGTFSRAAVLFPVRRRRCTREHPVEFSGAFLIGAGATLFTGEASCSPELDNCWLDWRRPA